MINTPEVIVNRPNSGIGLGDSFLEHGTHILTDYFTDQYLRYYNFAMYQQSPPQYTDILEIIGLPLKPKYILYRISENDFQ